tara:strand:- start:1230 stop:1910 length:681 start_codon:yes stop_codon:yes gene_type:complete
MKKIIIYTTNDKVISLQLVNKIISHDKFKDYKFDIILVKAEFLRKIKILIVMFFFGSLMDFLKKLINKISIEEILKKNNNCRHIDKIDENTKYDFGLSVYCSNKIKIPQFKIYNFHLGSLKTQRGSFIFFYKFLKNWNEITLSCHEMSEKFDVGKVINEKKINLKANTKASDIFFLYLENQNFLIDSINKLSTSQGKNYDNYEKLHLVPSFFQLLSKMTKYFFRKI